MADASGTLYTAGPYTTVDFSDESQLQAALATGPVNFGIDADALPSAAGNQAGWYAFGGTPGSFTNDDHCTPCFGFVSGSMSVNAAFAAVSQAYGVTVSPPAGAPTGNVYLWYTWSTVGIVDFPWIMSTASEAYVQNPTTVGQTPGPAPSPTPTPTPTPTPVPVGTTYTLTQGTDGSFTFTPASGTTLTLTSAQLQAIQTVQGIVLPTSRKLGAQMGPVNDGTQKRLDALEKQQERMMLILEKIGQQVLPAQKKADVGPVIRRDDRLSVVYPPVSRESEYAGRMR
jgi:hypothetical protein